MALRMLWRVIETGEQPMRKLNSWFVAERGQSSGYLNGISMDSSWLENLSESDVQLMLTAVRFHIRDEGCSRGSRRDSNGTRSGWRLLMRSLRRRGRRLCNAAGFRWNKRKMELSFTPGIRSNDPLDGFVPCPTHLNIHGLTC